MELFSVGFNQLEFSSATIDSLEAHMKTLIGQRVKFLLKISGVVVIVNIARNGEIEYNSRSHRIYKRVEPNIGCYPLSQPCEATPSLR